MLTEMNAPIDSEVASNPRPASPRRGAGGPVPAWTGPTPTRSSGLREIPRRTLDFAVAALLSLVALPLVVLAALAVKATSRGPAFYTQVRVGKYGRRFTIFKLRTMVDKCESLTGPRWTIPGDPRITPVGWFLRRSHLDELPQLLNVLLGDMSLIGPRPERPEFVQELSLLIPHYHDRHAVLPGITGLAQVQLPADSDVDSVRRKVRYDLYYVQHGSLWLDVRILLATALHLGGMTFEALQACPLIPGPQAVEADAPAPIPALRKLVA